MQCIYKKQLTLYQITYWKSILKFNIILIHHVLVILKQKFLKKISNLMFMIKISFKTMIIKHKILKKDQNH